MSAKFDPYHQWLGIPASEQPPNHYRLLAIPVFEESPTVVESAADRQMAHLRTFQTGQHSDLSQKLLNEVATAKVCLLNPEKKTAYDRSLRQQARATTLPTAQPLPAALGAGLADLFETPLASAAGVASKGRSKKSRPKPTALIVAAALTAVAVGFALWVTFGHDGTPNDAEIAKVAAPATSVKPAKEAAPKSLDLSSKEAPIAAPSPPKEKSNEGVPQAVAEANPPEPKTKGQTTTVPVADNTLVAKSASNVSPPAKPAPNEPEAGAPPKKLAPPAAEEQKQLLGEIDEVYKPNAAKNHAAKTALARRLLEDGRKDQASRAEQFVIFRRASEIARDAGEAELMLEAIDAISAAGFDVRSLQVKARFLKQLLAQGSLGGASQVSAASTSCVKFAEEAAAGGAIDEALDVLDAASKSLTKLTTSALTAQRAAKAALARARAPADKAERAKKAGESQEELDAIKSAQLAVTECAKDLQQSRHEYEAIQAAQERLKTVPDDPAACLVIGEWYCFRRGDWDEGLKFLAKGSDTALKAVAAEEIAAKPATVADKIARADVWWGLAEKATGKAKPALQRRAAKWYQEALPDLSSGLSRTKVELRLSQVSKEQDSGEEMPGKEGGNPPLAGVGVYLAELEASQVRLIPENQHDVKTDTVFHGKRSQHNLWAHPPQRGSSHIQYELGNRFSVLQGAVGIGDVDSVPVGSPLTFRIVGDGKQLWQSDPLQARGAYQAFRVKVAKIKSLELFVDCPGWNGAAHAMWLDPVLHR